MKLVYKILSAICSIAVLPVLFFVPLLRLKINLPLSIDLGIKEYSSIFDLIRASSGQTEQQKEVMQKLLDALMDKDSSLGAIFTNRPYLYAFFAFLILTALIALVLAVLPFVTKKTGALFGVAGGGLLSGFLMNAMFSAFAKPLLSGQIGLKSILGGGSAADDSGLGSLLTGLIGNAVSVEQLKLSFAYILVMLLFLLVIFICVAGVMEKTESK